MMKRECDNTIMLQCDNATMQECHRAWGMEQGARDKGQAACFGKRRSHTIVPLEKGGGDFGAGGLNSGNLINGYRLTIDDFRIEEMKNIQYRISNNESESKEVTTMLQCENATMQEWVFALKGQVISAQGNALGWKATCTPAVQFSVSIPVAKEGYKSQQVWVTTLQEQVTTLQGRVTTLQGDQYSQQVRVTTLQGSRYFQQVRVATLQGSRYFQQGMVSAVPASLSDSIFSENVKYRISNNESGRGQIPPPSGTPFNKGRLSHTIVPLEKGGGDFGAGGLKFYNSLFLIAYFLFPENIQYRIRNHQSGSEEMTTMQECHRAWSMEQGARGKGQAASFGWRLSHTIVPLEKGGGDFGAGGLNRGNLINDYRLTIDDFRIEEMKNIQYRIRNQKSGNEGVTAMLQCDNATMQECHRAWSMEQGARDKGQAASFGRRLSHTIVPLEKGGGDFGAGGLNRGNLINDYRLTIDDFRIEEMKNIQYRISNNESGNEGMSCKLNTTYPSLQTRGRGAGGLNSGLQWVSDSIFLISYFLFSENVKYRIRNHQSGNEEVSALKGQFNSAPGNVLGWPAYEIQFSRYLASGETVIHRAQAVRACLLPFTVFLKNN